MGNPFDFNRSRTIAEQVANVINEAMQAQSQAQQGRQYLGGSRLGEECARMLQYEYMGAPKSRHFSGEVLRIFERGHASEAAMIKRLRLAGFEIVTERKGGGQLGFATAWCSKTEEHRIKGHYDGVIVKAPEGVAMQGPAIWEHKCLGAKAFRAVCKHGVRKEKPVYAGQIATYQAYAELTENPALFTAENADTGELYAELVPFDAKLAQECTDRGVQVITATEAGETLPRPYPDADFFKCRFCDFQEECWRD